MVSPGGHADEGLVDALDHVVGADLVGDPVDRVDLLTLDRRGQVDRDEVAVLGGARSTPLSVPNRCRSVVIRSATSVVVRGHRVDLDGEVRVVGQLDLGPDVHLGGELQVLALLGRHLGDVDLRLPERAHVVLVHGLAVELRERLVDGLLQHGTPADPLVDDPRRDLALAEPGHLDLLADGLVCRVEAGLQLLVRHLDGHLDPGRVDGLEGTLHCGSPGMSADGVRWWVAGRCGVGLCACAGPARWHAALAPATKGPC